MYGLVYLNRAGSDPRGSLFSLLPNAHSWSRVSFGYDVQLTRRAEGTGMWRRRQWSTKRRRCTSTPPPRHRTTSPATPRPHRLSCKKRGSIPSNIYLTVYPSVAIFLITFMSKMHWTPQYSSTLQNFRSQWGGGRGKEGGEGEGGGGPLMGRRQISSLFLSLFRSLSCSVSLSPSLSPHPPPTCSVSLPVSIAAGYSMKIPQEGSEL